MNSVGVIQSGKIFFASFLLFLVLATGGVCLARLSHDVAVFWPANAAMVALCLIYGLWHLPAVLLGAFLGNIATQLLFGDPLILILGLPFANGLEILLVTIGLRALKLDETPIETPKSFMYFLGVLTFLVLPGAVIGASTIHTGFGLPFANSLIYWWGGDTLSSIIVLLPLLSTGWPRWSGFAFDRKTLLPVLKSLTILLLCSVFSMLTLHVLNLPLALAFMAPSCWLALQGKPFKVAAVGSVLVIGVSLLVIFGLWPQNNSGLRLRDQVFEAQLLTLLAILPSYAIAVAISGLARSQEQIEKSNMRLSVTLANMNQGVSCFDRNFKLTVWNDKYAHMFGMTKADVYAGVSFFDLLAVQAKNGDFAGAPRQLLENIMRDVRQSQEHVAETYLGNGRIIKSVHSPTPLGGWIGTHEDITEKRMMEKKLAYESMHDALTTLPNRRYFDKEIARKAKAAHEIGCPLTLFFVDLDHFKQINDSVGHNAGDALLRHTGETIRKVIDPADFVARLGGDEFAIVSKRFQSLEQAGQLANTLNEALRAPWVYKGQKVSCEVSIGITLGRGAKLDIERLRAEADIALYGAKRAGRGQHKAYVHGQRVA
ncbi:sensor domain-containing diguanylate cyclase [Maritalea myrionectae]|uniref:sensor domain-containing diguanylate cyclase n=1 Tax=Maritalea myrionectae TaxID=454601 RepID=UPI000406D133|nr:sensor domain-containing diguanylate cyclase [Maritalea myrionectae]